MSRRTTTAARQKRKLLSHAKKRRKELEFVEQYGIPSRLGTPSNLSKIAAARQRRAEFEENCKKILAQAKLLAIVHEDFDYFNLGAKDEPSVKRFRSEFEKRTAKYLGKNEPKTVLDKVTFDLLQEMVDLGFFGPVIVQHGTVPKVRKFKSGRIQVMRTGEPDYDFLVNSLRPNLAQKER
jgi:hypothetical protein